MGWDKGSWRIPFGMSAIRLRPGAREVPGIPGIRSRLGGVRMHPLSWGMVSQPPRGPHFSGFWDVMELKGPTLGVSPLRAHSCVNG